MKPAGGAATEPDGQGGVLLVADRSYYFYEGEDLICQQDVGALIQDDSQYEPKFLLLDHLGSTRAELLFDPVSLAPQIQEYYDLMPYGEVIDPPTTQESVLFTGKPKDIESGLDYFGARYYGAGICRFTSSDPVISNKQRIISPQQWNLYSYARNNPLSNIDPDGRDAIAIIFPDYKIATPVGKIGGLGHAGVVTIDSKGRTKYFEYGRYDEAGKGLVRGRNVPTVTMDSNGRPTQESLNGLLRSISQQAGHGGRIEGAYFKADDKQTAQMNQYAEGRETQNTNPKRESYDLYDNNCATFMDKTIEAGGVKLPSDLSAKPTGQIDDLQGAAGNKVKYDPSANKTSIQPNKQMEEQR